jgi:hypothetical protein
MVARSCQRPMVWKDCRNWAFNASEDGRIAEFAGNRLGLLGRVEAARPVPAGLPEVADRRPNLVFDLALTAGFEFIGLSDLPGIVSDLPARRRRPGRMPATRSRCDPDDVPTALRLSP